MSDRRGQSHAAADFGHFGEIHGSVQVFLNDEWGRRPAWQQSEQFQSVSESARMLLDNFADGSAHGKFPQVGMLHLSTNPE
jgi:hypothetical protein